MVYQPPSRQFGILHSNGNTVVNYTYDAWGNILSTTGSLSGTLGFYNPLRYRGYVYDAETAHYYLQSRYYYPYQCRFINADALVATGQGILGNNMFAYCRNNPVVRKDATGTEDLCVTTNEDDNNTLNDIGPVQGSPSGISGNTSGNSPGYSYSSPKGGGVTTSIKVGDVTVDFGHGGRHPDFSDISGLENAIAKDVVTRPPTTGYRGEYDITFGNSVFTYRYWTISPTHINVGTYFVKPVIVGGL